MYKIICCFLLVSVWANNCVAQEQSSRKEELHYLSTIIDKEILEYADIEIPHRNSIRVNFDKNGQYISLLASGNQPKKNNGHRAEISVDFPYQEGETVRYSWQFMIPQDFQSDAPQNRWWIIGQWHDQPNRNLGETWDSYPSNSPPIILGYGQVNGTDVLSFSYGAPESKPIALLDFDRGVWQDITVIITWSQTKKGHIELSLNNKTVKVDGPNMLNDFQHYLKVGTYRHPGIKGEGWINVRNITIKRLSDKKV